MCIPFQQASINYFTALYKAVKDFFWDLIVYVLRLFAPMWNASDPVQGYSSLVFPLCH